jgi:14-3-3 protein epsilon
MLSVAFKNLVTPKRTTWRTIMAVEQSQQHMTGASTQDAIHQYKAVIEERLHKNCEDIVDQIKTLVIPQVEKYHENVKTHNAYEEKAFFYKMIGDYYRYASEAVSSKAS